MGNQIIKPTADVINWDEYEAVSCDLNFEYWSPKPDEMRNGIYQGVHERDVPDFNDPEKTTTLPCAVFLDPVEDKVWVNGSKILLSTLAEVSIGKAVRVEYAGKVQSRNGNNCDNWKCRILERKSQ